MTKSRNCVWVMIRNNLFQINLGIFTTSDLTGLNQRSAWDRTVPFLEILVPGLGEFFSQNVKGQLDRQSWSLGLKNDAEWNNFQENLIAR